MQITIKEFLKQAHTYGVMNSTAAEENIMVTLIDN